MRLDLCCVEQRNGSETGIRRGGPSRGLALIALQVELGTLGLGQYLGCQADPCLLQASRGMGKDLGGVRELLLGQGLVLTVWTESSKNIPNRP